MASPENELLKDYRRKRLFTATSEPAGGREKEHSEPVFVIQKHDASALHYDFRLEISGVLKSWAVPKGPSTDPSNKRLAMPTEDHPLEYAGFEGTIPKGQYGGGIVMVWDAGTYRNLKTDKAMEQAYEEGHITFWLNGQKLKGSYALTRVAQGKDERWILVKMNDENARSGDEPVLSQPNSAVTGRTLQEISGGQNK